MTPWYGQLVLSTVSVNFSLSFSNLWLSCIVSCELLANLWVMEVVHTLRVLPWDLNLNNCNPTERLQGIPTLCDNTGTTAELWCDKSRIRQEVTTRQWWLCLTPPTHTCMKFAARNCSYAVCIIKPTSNIVSLFHNGVTKINF